MASLKPGDLVRFTAPVACIGKGVKGNDDVWVLEPAHPEDAVTRVPLRDGGFREFEWLMDEGWDAKVGDLGIYEGSDEQVRGAHNFPDRHWVSIRGDEGMVRWFPVELVWIEAADDDQQDDDSA